MLDVLKTDPNAPADLTGSTYTRDELRAMQRTVINVFQRWSVSDVDAANILGGISVKTFRRWKDHDYGRVNRDMADRMSNLLGIHKALRIVFSEPTTGYQWMRTNNRGFGGQSALDILKHGGMEDIIRIRRYLDSVRGGW